MFYLCFKLPIGKAMVKLFAKFSGPLDSVYDFVV